MTAVPATLDVTSTTPIPFGRLVKVEFRKSYDTMASFVLLCIIAGLVLVAELIAALVTGLKNVDNFGYSDFATVAGFITSLLLPVLGIMLVTAEWGQRTAMVTFAVEPRRTLVIWAKLVVGVLLALAMVVFAMVIALPFNLLQGGLAGHMNWHWDGWGFLGFTVSQVFSMLGGFALAALFLNTPSAIVVYFAYKFLLPTLLGIGGHLMHWFGVVERWGSFEEAQSPLYDSWSKMSGQDWGHLIVSGFIWLVVPLAIGLWRINRAEVK